MYQHYIKRVLDFVISLLALILLSPLLLVLIVVGWIKLGGNIFFTQFRPGMIGADGKERIFKLINVQLAEGRVSKEEYDRKQAEAKRLIEEYNRRNR